MADFLKESGARSNRPTVVQALMPTATAKYEENIKYMTELGNQSMSCDDEYKMDLNLVTVIAERRAHPNDKKDSLNAMLHGKDPKTGEGLSDKSIMNNLVRSNTSYNLNHI